MKLRRERYDLDLSQIGDEELVIMAKECGFHPAETELILRYQLRRQRIISALARSTRLPQADWEDAQQNAVLGTIEAIAAFDTVQLHRPKNCSFRTFLRVVLEARFKDFLRRHRRVERRRDRATNGNRSLERVLNGPHVAFGRRQFLSARQEDPATAMARREALERLEQAVEQLQTADGHLWRRLASGQRLRAIANELDVSYDTAKRRRRKLLAQLTLRLRDLLS